MKPDACKMLIEIDIRSIHGTYEIEGLTVLKKPEYVPREEVGQEETPGLENAPETDSPPQDVLHRWRQAESKARSTTNAVTAFFWLLLTECTKGQSNPRAKCEFHRVTQGGIVDSVYNAVRKGQQVPGWVKEILGENHYGSAFSITGSGQKREINLSPSFCTPSDISCWTVAGNERVRVDAGPVAEQLQKAWEESRKHQTNGRAPRTFVELIREADLLDLLADLGKRCIDVFTEDIIDSRDAMLLGQTRRVQICSILIDWIQAKERELELIYEEAGYDSPDELRGLARRVEKEFVITTAVLKAIKKHTGQTWKEMEKEIDALVAELKKLTTPVNVIFDLNRSDGRYYKGATPVDGKEVAEPLKLAVGEVVKCFQDQRIAWKRELTVNQRRLESMLKISKKKWRQSDV
jgi:hypothetical protein